MFFQKIAWSFLTNAFAAWIIVDMLLSNHLDNVGTSGLLDEYDFIIGQSQGAVFTKTFCKNNMNRGGCNTAKSNQMSLWPNVAIFYGRNLRMYLNC